MPFYCKNCKKHTGNMFPKKLVLILKNKIQGKSKAFFDKINNKYDLEQLLKHFFFLLMYVIKEHGDLLCKV